MKVSYSCIQNIKLAINSHNRKILHQPLNNQSRTCTCINKTECPLYLLSENIPYYAHISSNKKVFRKTVTRKFITAFWKQNFKQGTRTMKKLLTTKNKRIMQNYLMNTVKLKSQRKNQL